MRSAPVARCLSAHLKALAQKDTWGNPRGAKPDPAFVVDLTRVVDSVDAGVARQAVAHIRAWPLHFGLDSVLVPATKTLIRKRCRSGIALKALHAAATTHLKMRIAEPLEPPQDWTRPSVIGCKCEHCQAFSGFLVDAKRECWTLRAVQHVRAHVESEIRRGQVDVDYRTERRGSPHSLVTVKNQASYKRRVAQRVLDIADLAVLQNI
jgi:hypothetical protein